MNVFVIIISSSNSSSICLQKWTPPQNEKR